MVRFGILRSLLAVSTILATSTFAAKAGMSSGATGIHASVDLRTLSQAKDEIFD